MSEQGSAARGGETSVPPVCPLYPDLCAVKPTATWGTFSGDTICGILAVAQEIAASDRLTARQWQERVKQSGELAVRRHCPLAPVIGDMLREIVPVLADEDPARPYTPSRKEQKTDPHEGNATFQ